MIYPPWGVNKTWGIQEVIIARLRPCSAALELLRVYFVLDIAVLVPIVEWFRPLRERMAEVCHWYSSLYVPAQGVCQWKRVADCARKWCLPL